jgi:hypothetical protein
MKLLLQVIVVCTLLPVELVSTCCSSTTDAASVGSGV